MHKVLVANRGEIACRIIATCRRIGLKTVAVYSDADRAALHRDLADEAVAIGPARSSESYLVAERLLQAARDTAADAVHPGYGFLAESPAFAEAVCAAGLTWVGPSPATIEAMGDKDSARRIALAAGVPVLPGSARFTLECLDGLNEAAERIGYPLLVKAAGGGGGIGMQRVDGPGDLTPKVHAT